MKRWALKVDSTTCCVHRDDNSAGEAKYVSDDGAADTTIYCEAIIEDQQESRSSVDLV